MHMTKSTITHSDRIKDLSIRTEQDVLAFLIKCDLKDLIAEMLMDLNEDLFQNPNNREIYRAITHIYLTTGQIDTVSVHNAIKTKKDTVAYFEDTILAMQMGGIYATKEKIHTLKSTKQLNDISNLVIGINSKLLEETPTEHLRKITDFIFNEYRQENHSNVNLSKAIKEVIATANDKSLFGFRWIDDLPELDNATGGIEVGKTYILGGLKKGGKTRFAIAVIKSLINQGQIPLFLSMEMKEFEIAKLLLATFSGIPTHVFNKELSSQDEDKIKRASDTFVDFLRLDTESFLSTEKIRAKVWRAAQQGTKVVVLDYLQRMQFPSEKYSNRATIIADTSARLADIARDNKVALILLSQLRNEAESEGINDMQHLKDSGGIGEAGDAILTLNNRKRQSKDENKYELTDDEKRNGVDFWITIEQRNGETHLLKTKAKLGICQFRHEDAVLHPSSHPITQEKIF
jgi:replicative DNA helicase